MGTFPPSAEAPAETSRAREPHDLVRSHVEHRLHRCRCMSLDKPSRKRAKTEPMWVIGAEKPVSKQLAAVTDES